MKTAKFIRTVRIPDPDTGDTVELEVYKHENGGIFAIDSSYLEQNFEDETEPVIPDPLTDIAYDMAVQVKLLN